MFKIDRFTIPDNGDQKEKSMQEQNVYQRLADHLSNVGMGYPVRETLLEILRENLNPLEAEISWRFLQVLSLFLLSVFPI